MNILFSCGDYYPNLGGATSLVDDLMGALLRSGHSARVLTRLQPATTERETWHGYQIDRLDYPLLYEKWEWRSPVLLRSPAILARIVRLLREYRIATVCVGLLDMSAWYFILLRPLLGFRFVVYLHGGETRALPSIEPSYASLLRASLRSADAVIAVSEELKVEAARYWPGALDKTTVILNAIDLRQIRSAVPFQHPRRYIAAVGRLVPEKDFATLIQAFATVQEDIGEVDLLIAGAGKQEAMLRQKALACPRPERVVFLGRVERETALSVMMGAEFVALPSVTEGFPIVAVEALALHKPLLGTSIPGIAAIVENDRQGNLFPPGDVNALAALIRAYCNDAALLAKRASGAAASNLDRYDIELVAARHLAAFEGTL